MNKNEDKVLLTQEGLDKLNNELDDLVNHRRIEVIEELKKAYANHDLSENFDLQAAKVLQGEIEFRINEINHILSNYTLISEEELKAQKSDIVNVGSVVTYLNESDHKKHTIKVVGMVESDPFHNPPQISNDSPFAQAILSAKVNEVIKIKNVKSPYSIKILNIK